MLSGGWSTWQLDRPAFCGGLRGQHLVCNEHGMPYVPRGTKNQSGKNRNIMKTRYKWENKTEMMRIKENGTQQRGKIINKAKTNKTMKSGMKHNRGRERKTKGRESKMERYFERKEEQQDEEAQRNATQGAKGG